MTNLKINAMKTFKVIFYIREVPVDGGEILIKAEDYTQAEQALLLRLNETRDIPSIWDSYSEPIEIKY